MIVFFESAQKLDGVREIFHEVKEKRKHQLPTEKLLSEERGDKAFSDLFGLIISRSRVSQAHEGKLSPSRLPITQSCVRENCSTNSSPCLGMLSSFSHSILPGTRVILYPGTVYYQISYPGIAVPGKKISLLLSLHFTLYTLAKTKYRT